MEMLSKEESALINTDALNKAADADAALTELAEESVSFRTKTSERRFDLLP